MLLGFFLPRVSFAYKISGVADFSYHIRKLQSENSPAHTDGYFSQNYSVSFGHYLLDPRFLHYSAAVGYNVTDMKHTSIEKTDALNYSVSLSFFPTLWFNWDLFSSQNNLTTDEANNTNTYDIKSSTYGGSFRINLQSGGRRRNNNNNNNYNNNNNNYNNRGARAILPWITPNIALHYISSDMESLNINNPRKETRTDTNADFVFGKRSYSMTINAGREEFHDEIMKRDYEITRESVDMRTDVSKSGKLTFHGKLSDMDSLGFTGINASEKRGELNAGLYFKGDVVNHDYNYAHNSVENSFADIQSDSIGSNVYFLVTDRLSLKAGVAYSVNDFKGKIPGTSSLRSTSENVMTGFSYQDTYAPDFLGPFSFNTNYDFALGTSKVENLTTGESGSGGYTTNGLSLSLNSTGWTSDNLTVTYAFNKRSDHSPLQNENENQKIFAHVRTTRIPKTLVEGSIDYNRREGSSKDPTGGYLSMLTSNIFQNGRTKTYSMTLTHDLTTYLVLKAGTIRGDQQNMLQTLSTLQPEGRFESEYISDYVSGTFSWMFTRRLLYTADVRDEWRRTSSQDSASQKAWMKMQTVSASTGLQYFFRQVTLGLSYSYKRDMPENNLSSTEQNIYAKLTRSF